MAAGGMPDGPRGAYFLEPAPDGSENTYRGGYMATRCAQEGNRRRFRIWARDFHPVFRCAGGTEEILFFGLREDARCILEACKRYVCVEVEGAS